ncbi:F-box protein At1g78280-like isoform X2 [Triticum dicoccoides]|uniref:F-box protein At1g78280-like isoform X2 n=1 Tax=Triticum dicoccoides TaxID=85692 RepID=UPI000E78BF2A|nr:F-box protein At1g78280-like isoform X2 [Triticum dicoccoides]
MESAGNDRRGAALGGLAVLPDELLCAIVDLLQPTDIGRLACVSSVMYILCNEEPLWMSKYLFVGGHFEYKGSWKKTTLSRLNLCSEKSELEQKARHFDGFNSLYLYRRWYRCFTTLSSYSFDNGHVERKDDLSLDHFRSQYDGKGPVLLGKLAESWPARTKWSMQQLVHDYGEVTFRISQRSPKKIIMKLKDYVSYMELQHDEDPLYIFDDKFGESAPALLEDYRVPHLFQEDLFDVLDYEQRPAFRWFIIGPERSGASWHVDPGLTSAWNTLLCGRKRWALYPPGRVPGGVTVHVSAEDGDVDIDTPTSLQWWLDIYPHLAEHEKPLECTQLPGETIFVPSGWWHCVLNLETTVAVTQNFVNQSNFEHVCLDMAPGHCHKGVCRAGLLAVPGKSVRDMENHPPGTITLNHNDMTCTEERLKGSGSVRASNSESQYSSFEFSDVDKSLENQVFSYDIGFLSQFLEKEKDHYTSVWSPTNPIGQREAREWLRRLWVLKPELRGLIWKGACLAINVDKWYACLEEIRACHSLPAPSEDEKLPVGTGSNPVFIVSDNVIKINAEGGLGYSAHGLGTELEFYDLLRKVGSPLVNHIPEIIASGFLVYEDGVYRTVPWNGKGMPDVLAKYYPLELSYANSCFPLGLWSKQQFGMDGSAESSNRPIWPYMVTRKCKGDIFAHVRDTLSKADLLNLASSLGVQMRNIHLLPLPHGESLPEPEDNNVKDSDPPEWKQVISTLNRRKNNIKKHLANWGGTVPTVLIEKAEEYLPPDMNSLIKFVKDGDGDSVYTFPSWIHSDIMDDNILTQRAPEMGSLTDTKSTGDGDLEKLNEIHIIDFSDLYIGDPLCDLIPLHLDVFRGDIDLLREYLRSYQLPFLRGKSNDDIYKSVQNSKFSTASYRAMCYCILHDDNVLAAIFGLWKELRDATSWEDVEHLVWDDLNRYQQSSPTPSS